MTTPAAAGGLRIGYVPGVTLTKWTTIWLDRFAATPLHVLEVTEQDQRKALDQRLVDLCFVRLPIGTEGLHLIPMYDEVPVAWVSREHPITAFDEVTLADLAAETVLTSVDSDSVNRVALETAVLLVPMSVARSHSRRDLTYRPVTDGPTTTIGLAWNADEPHPLTDEFIGVVRGRTRNSSRTQSERAVRPNPTRKAKASAAPRAAAPRRRGSRRR